MKSVDVRVREAVGLRSKLSELGLTAEDPAIRDIHQRLNEFVRGTGFTGKIPIPAVHRIAVLKLSLTPHVESAIVLAFDRTRALASATSARRQLKG